ncbi:tRNA/rRNA methyltransferase SpoU family protein [Prunus dulcis]|uniref:tRNA/rRNA methyltransferase SpoU family protein n=1 Tax=Prunus dulcis TaxID=3755 RepID=A0A4Y1QN68_PRUDU|nr:tRNA/rRNA methyltransferase SpoU family protein [Prunus dulcis]
MAPPRTFAFATSTPSKTLVSFSRREIVIFAALRSLMMLCLSITTLLPRAPLFFLAMSFELKLNFSLQSLGGTGLSAKELEICDFFVYIPQYGGGTASLNVTVAASIVLHQFGVWAGFPERTRDGNKFIVAEKPVKQTRRSFCAETADSVIEERKCRKEHASNGFFDESGNENSSSNLLDGLFADDFSESCEESELEEGYPIPWRLLGNTTKTVLAIAPMRVGNTCSKTFSVDSNPG